MLRQSLVAPVAFIKDMLFLKGRLEHAWASLQAVCIAWNPGGFAKSRLIDGYSLLSSARLLPVPPTVLRNCRRTQGACYGKGVFPQGKKKLLALFFT